MTACACGESNGGDESRVELSDYKLHTLHHEHHHHHALADLYDLMKSTRQQSTYLSLVDIAGVIRDIFDDAERERLAALLR